MKWTYSIKNKFLASVVLLALCVLVLLSNYLDRLHTRHVKSAISTLYEDRLIAEGYILKMTSHIYQIREVLQTDQQVLSKSAAIGKLMGNFNNTYEAYLKTKLTASEKTTALALMHYIKKLEQTFTTNNYSPAVATDQALAALNKLSTVQLDESKLIMKNVESEYANIKASSQFAFAIVILILVVLQALVFSGKTLIPLNQPQDPRLN